MEQDIFDTYELVIQSILVDVSRQCDEINKLILDIKS